MKKLGNWYLMWNMLSLALVIEQDMEPKKDLKVGDKDYWPKYAALPKGCKIHEHQVNFKDSEDRSKIIMLYMVASNEKTAEKKFDKLIIELKAWEGQQKELSSIIGRHNKYCAPIKVL